MEMKEKQRFKKEMANDIALKKVKMNKNRKVSHGFNNDLTAQFWWSDGVVSPVVVSYQ